MGIIDLKEIEQIETEDVEKNPNWFYHGFDFAFTADIINEGILARKHLGDFYEPNG